jgi:hypothetical protein
MLKPNTTTDSSKKQADHNKTQAEARAAWDIAPLFPVADDPNSLKIAVWTALNCKTQLEAALV